MDVRQRSLPPLAYRGAREICAAVGISWKDIAHYVHERGLPAFKIGGAWVALPDDLREWLQAQRNESVKRR